MIVTSAKRLSGGLLNGGHCVKNVQIPTNEKCQPWFAKVIPVQTRLGSMPNLLLYLRLGFTLHRHKTINVVCLSITRTATMCAKGLRLTPDSYLRRPG